MKKIIWILIALIIIVGGVLLFKNRTIAPTESDLENVATTTSSASSAATSTASGDTAQGTVKEFVVTGSNMKFDVTNISVNKGDTVKIVFKNAQGMHDWVIDEFNARTKVLPAGQSETITFVADKTGTFEYYCSVGSHREMGMKGTLTVN